MLRELTSLNGTTAVCLLPGNSILVLLSVLLLQACARQAVASHTTLRLPIWGLVVACVPLYD